MLDDLDLVHDEFVEYSISETKYSGIKLLNAFSLS
jgi:hypothetical protein